MKLNKFLRGIIGLFTVLVISFVLSDLSHETKHPFSAWIPFLILTVAAMALNEFKGANRGIAFDLVINDTAYAGEFASFFWLPATFGMDTVVKGAVYVKDGIHKQHTIGTLDFANPLQPRKKTPTPTPSSDFTVGSKVIVPQDVMLYTEFDPRDWEVHWLTVQQSNTLLARELPVTAENYMMQQALARAFEQLELGIWQGSTAYQSSTTFGDAKYQIQFFDGFIKLFLADSAVQAVAGPVALTNANIGDKMQLCLNLVLKAQLANVNRYKRLKFFVSVASEQLYQQFVTSQPYKNNDTTERGINRFLGYDVVPLAGMPDNTIVLAEGIMGDPSSNLYLGMNSTQDNNIQLQRLQNNSELFFLKGLMKYAVQYGKSNEIVLYTTLTSADFL